MSWAGSSQNTEYLLEANANTNTDNKLKDHDSAEIKICKGKEETVPRNPAEHVFVVRVASSCSMFTESRVDKSAVVEYWKL